MKKETQNPVNSTTMITSLFYLIFLLTSQIISAAGQTYTPTEHTLLNCGAATRLPSSDGQSWDADAGTKLSPDISTPSLSSPAEAEQDSSITSPVPYLSARIIHSKFSYIFPLSSGQKILRLYFYPATYTSNTTGGQSFDKTQSFFGVTANQYTLLTNFSASLTASGQNPTAASFVKEFIVNVRETQSLNLTFLPSPNSYAFINGIEVVSVPADFYMGSHNQINNPLTYVNFPNTPYSLDQNGTAFETVYRVNVGGGTVTGEDDTGMFRDWLLDNSFLSGGIIGNPLSNNTMPLTYSAPQTPNYSAPASVYQTARAMGATANLTPPVNLTWSFEVDTGFFYLLRLHFCEFMPGTFFKPGQKIFTIFINNMTADEDADILYFAGGTGIPVFRDYVVSVGNPTGKQSKYNLFLALAPAAQMGPTYLDASLNGLEVFKLSNATGNLAGVNPELQNSGSSSPNSQQPGSKKKKKSSIGMIAGIVGGVAGAAALIFLLILFIRRRRRGPQDFDGKSATKSSWLPLSTQSKSTTTAGSYGSSPLPYDLCRRFLLEEIKTATSDFDPALIIGNGGFGKVYKGFVDNNLTAVAIKRLDTTSRQGAHEFRTEIEMLSNLRHVHLVSLIGYCDENKEMILVYDYMSNGTLRDHLYRTENPPLTWKSRLQVAAGAARGLNYLHSGAKHNIIHRDVKSTNILLDEKFVAKVSDFGLSKLGPTGGHQSHVSTVVKGSFGYVDPEYYKKQQLTEKSDVYSFGVVLFEVLCARPAIVANLSRDQVNLAEWARRCNKKGTIDQMVDPNLRGQIAPECLKSYSDIAVNCLKEQGSDRPAMSDVVWSLEFALQLQEAADKDGDNREQPIVFAPFSPETDATTISIDDDSATLTGGMLTSSGMYKGQSDTTGGMTSSTNSTTDDKLKSASVFSEIMNPAGR